MLEIINHIKNSENILLISHMHPDGDAIGSLIALGLAIKNLNKNITLYNESPIPAVYKFLPCSNIIVNKIESILTIITFLI